MLEAIVQIKINRVAWSKARLSWGAGLAPLRERARRSRVVAAGAAEDVGDGDTKSGLQIQWTLVVIGGEDVGDGNTESGSAVQCSGDESIIGDSTCWELEASAENDTGCHQPKDCGQEQHYCWDDIFISPKHP